MITTKIGKTVYDTLKLTTTKNNIKIIKKNIIDYRPNV